MEGYPGAVQEAMGQEQNRLNYDDEPGDASRADVRECLGGGFLGDGTGWYSLRFEWSGRFGHKELE